MRFHRPILIIALAITGIFYATGCETIRYASAPVCAVARPLFSPYMAWRMDQSVHFDAPLALPPSGQSADTE